jgi:hypothetical protein
MSFRFVLPAPIALQKFKYQKSTYVPHQNGSHIFTIYHLDLTSHHHRDGAVVMLTLLPLSASSGS